MYRNPGDRTDPTSQRCGTHPFALATAQCRTCGGPYCDECLVFAFGALRPPYCVGCALVAAGVRRRR